MKKLFTLLTLLCAVTGVWAQDVTYKSMNANDIFWFTAADVTTYASESEGWVTKNTTKSTKNFEPTIDPETDEAFSPKHAKIDVDQVKQENSAYIILHVTNVAKLRVYGYAGSSGRTLKATINTDSAVDIFTKSGSGGCGSGDITISEPTANNDIKIWASGDMSFYAIKVLEAAGSSDDPAINVAASAAITATEAGVEATENIGIKGVNLTGSKLTATLSPAVEGLTVTLDEDAIVDGTIATQAVLHYTATENAKGTTTLTLSDGTTSKEVAISYTAMVTPVELQTVSGTVTWDISTDITGDVQFAEGDRDERVYANIPGLEFKSTFDATTLAFAGEWAFRAANSCAQNGTLHLIASAPGTVEVTFSNTGGSNKNRFVKVTCGEAEPTIGKVEADGTTKRTEKFDVVAGDVYIAGYTPDEGGNSALRFFKVVYTEGDATGIQTVNNNAANNGVIYNLAGQRVMNAQKGLFIINGNKVVIK